MDREVFLYRDKDYNEQLAAIKKNIEAKYAEQKTTLQGDISIREKKTDKNFEAFDEIHGTTGKDKENKDAGLKANAQYENNLLDQAMAKEIAEAEKKLEKTVWKDHGSRIKAKEAAFGPNDPEVTENRRQREANQKRQQALEASRKAQEKSQITKDFNKGQARQNVKDQFHDKGGKINDGKTR